MSEISTKDTDPDLQLAKLKAGLREKALVQRATLSSGDRVEAAAAAAKHFLENIQIDGGISIAAYWPIRDEIDCKPLLISLMDNLHPVCLPVVMGEDVSLEFRFWEVGAPLYPAGFGTLAPAETAPVTQPDLIIIPLLGFDKRGTRLGYGQGYYDRTIAAMNKPPTLVGYAFGVQELDDIPREAHDIPLDYLVTEAGVKRFGD